MELDELKKWLSGLPVTGLVQVLGILEAELRERGLRSVAVELGLARGLLRRQLHGPAPVDEWQR